MFAAAIFTQNLLLDGMFKFFLANSYALMV